MQQTEKYKLNLIESSDPFLPEGLNQNTQKIEDAMTAHEAAVEARMDATDQRVTVLEAHKFACGTYTGTNHQVTQTVQLPFTPKAVFIRMFSAGSGVNGLFVLDSNGFTGYDNRGVLVEDGFSVTGELNSGCYNFIAFA